VTGALWPHVGWPGLLVIGQHLTTCFRNIRGVFRFTGTLQSESVNKRYLGMSRNCKLAMLWHTTAKGPGGIKLKIIKWGFLPFLDCADFELWYLTCWYIFYLLLKLKQGLKSNISRNQVILPHSLLFLNLHVWKQTYLIDFGLLNKDNKLDIERWDYKLYIFIKTPKLIGNTLKSIKI